MHVGTSSYILVHHHTRWYIIIHVGASSYLLVHHLTCWYIILCVGANDLATNASNEKNTKINR